MQTRITDWKAPSYVPVYRERTARLRKIRRDLAFADALARFYRSHPVEWIEDWAMTYDPRNVPKGRPAFVPFMLMPRQRECIEWLWERFQGQESACVEKSRDVGISWLMVAFAVWLWLWHPGAIVGFGSYEQDKVDELGNPSSLLEKCRLILSSLPPELKPPGLNEARGGHLKHMTLENPHNGNVIFGDVGDNIGRGARASIYFVDESAFLARPERADAGLAATADCIIHASTAHGTGKFYQKVTSGDYPVFRFHWTQDPRKDKAWYERQKRTLDPVILAQEVDIDHTAAVQGVIIEGKWVEAARRIRGLVRDWPIYADGIGGLDVGGGSAESVFVARFGPWVDPPKARQDGDTTATASWAIECCKAAGVQALNYDPVGVGAGVQSTLSRIEPEMVTDQKGRQHLYEIRTQGVNVGMPPTDRIWPSGRRSREMFANLKAEMWWVLRERFRATWEHVRYLETSGAEGQLHDLDDLIVLPADGAERLATQLSAPTMDYTSNGKMRVESKDALKARGIPSPDHAEALSLTVAPPPPRIDEDDLEGFY